MKLLKKLDIYIIKKYLSTFFFTVLLISAVAVVIDYAEKIERITNEDISMYEVAIGYYLNFIPWINGISLASLFIIGSYFFHLQT